MPSQQVTWVGSQVEDFTIDQLLGGGSFSRVYAGTAPDGRTRKAFKVARPADTLGGSDAMTGCLPTRAILQMEGAIAELEPDTGELLRKQAEKLQAITTKGLPEVEQVSASLGLTWYRMPLLEGKTLRESIAAREPIMVDMFIDLVAKLNRLSSDPAFQYHGDLKPENVMVTKTGVTVLDPGYFGPLLDSKNRTENVAVTTPAYYPFLMPDDPFALGLILWEIASGQAPLAVRKYARDFDTAKVDAELLNVVREEEATGKAFFSAILGIRPLSEKHPHISPDYERFLLKALRLEMRGNVVALSEGFRSFSAMSGALMQLQAKGVTQLSLS